MIRVGRIGRSTGEGIKSKNAYAHCNSSDKISMDMVRYGFAVCGVECVLPEGWVE